jgi:hypothetical protein
MTRQLRVAVLSGLFLLSSLAIVRSARAQNVPPMTPMPVMDQMTNIPYFTLRNGMSSTLTLQNLAPTPTKVTVTVFNTEGRAHVLDPITLDPHSFKEVQLGDVAPEGFDSGNVEVAFNGISMAVTCQVSVFSLEKRVSFESREQDMMDFESTNLAGIVSLPQGGDGFLAVTNVSKNTLTFQLTVGSLKKTDALLPRETRLIKLNEDELAAPTLVKLQHNGLPGDLITTGYVLNLKDGYSSGFAMVDPGIMRSSVLAGAHFRAGQPDPSEGFPEGTRFRSPLLLANTSAAPVIAHVSVDYTVREKVEMTPIDPNKADATEDKFKKTIAVKTLTIAPGDVQRVELSNALDDVGQVVEAGVDVAYDAAPGSIIGHLTSVDRSGDYAFEVPIKDPDAMSEGMESSYPWTLENGTATVLHLKNTTKETQKVGVLIRYAGGTYDPGGYDLQPYQTLAVDIQKLKDSKKPDALGHLLPQEATRGQVAWIQQIPYTVIGRAEGTDVEAGIAKSFSCIVGCCMYFSDDLFVEPGILNGVVGGGGVLSGTKVGTDCNSNLFQFNNLQASTWITSNASVATVNSGGSVHMAGPGSAVITGNFTNNSYYWSGPRCIAAVVLAAAAATVNVLVPYRVEPIATSSQSFVVCGSNGNGWYRVVTNQLQDQNGTGVPKAGIAMADQIQFTGTNQLGLKPGTGQSTTDSNGSWADFYSTCSTACSTPSSPGESDALQFWTYSGLPLPHSNLLVFKCGSVTIDGF